MSERIDWAGLLRAAARAGLGPRTVWDLTPWELAAALGRTGAGAMGRARLEELAALYPDGGSDDRG